jgi:mono/diheme cytochrome c family protein
MPAVHQFLRRPVLLAIVGGVTTAVLAGSLYVSNAVANQQPNVPRGAQVFAQNCQVCHGVNASGRMGPALMPIPPDITNAPRPAVVQQLTGLVRNGIPGAMPGFLPQQISDADVAALVDYLFDVSANYPTGRTLGEAIQPVGAVPNTADRAYFPQTGHTVSGAFKAYWEANNGARLFGYPLSEEYTHISADGQPVTAQMFERARFEYHPSIPGGVALGRIGAEEVELRTHFGGGGEEEGGPEE